MVKPDHKRKMKIDNQYVSIGDAAKMMGVSVPTLRRWHRQGKFEVEFRTLGGHRRYSIPSIREFLGLASTQKTVGYFRGFRIETQATLFNRGSTAHLSGIFIQTG